jgi:hypothetical protein
MPIISNLVTAESFAAVFALAPSQCIAADSPKGEPNLLLFVADDIS